jgi:hypothetical protein
MQTPNHHSSTQPRSFPRRREPSKQLSKHNISRFQKVAKSMLFQYCVLIVGGSLFRGNDA